MSGYHRGMLPRARLVVLAACLAVGGLAAWRAGPPAPRDADAPLHDFSAMRARARLTELLADEAPHPVGSAANTAVRARLVAQLRALGLTVEELPAFSCSDHGSCASVVNVLVRVPGTGPGPALLLASHYDSVPAGPGAADDGHGVVVVLEALRALLADGPPRTPLMAVFTDGEEAGLLGARAFVRHAAFADVGAVINIEARGTGGAARMFETSDGNAALVAAYAAGVPRPSAQSLSYEVYRRLPNDTDLTIFKKAGAQGLGFAFIGGVRRYHTPLDDLAHLDLGSVQQQGDAVLGTARQLLAAGVTPPAGNATYVDLFSAFVLRWPAALDLPLAALALLASLLAALRAVRRPVPSDISPPRPRAIFAAAAATLLAPLAGAAGSFVVLWLVGLCTRPIGTWPAGLEISLLAGALAASTTSVLALRGVARRVGAHAQALGTWIVWAALACALAVVLPGASILMIAPAVLAGLGLLLAPRALAWVCGLAAALVWCVWVPLLPALTEALGLDAVVLGALAGWTWTAASPALADRPGEPVAARLAGVLALAAVAFGIVAATTPRVTTDLPAKLNVFAVHDLDAGTSRLVLDTLFDIDGLPPEYMVDPWRKDAALPWSTRSMYAAPPVAATNKGAREGPRWLTRTSEAHGDSRTITATLHARPDALAMVVLAPATLTSLEIGGRTLDVTKLQRGPDDSRLLRLHSPPREGVELIAELRGEAPWLLADMLPGLTEPGPARPETRVPYQNGDLRIAFLTVTP